MKTVVISIVPQPSTASFYLLVHGSALFLRTISTQQDNKGRRRQLQSSNSTGGSGAFHQLWIGCSCSASVILLLRKCFFHTASLLPLLYISGSIHAYDTTMLYLILLCCDLARDIASFDQAHTKHVHVLRTDSSPHVLTFIIRFYKQ